MAELQLVLAGAAVGNGNRGVEALGRSVADAVDRDESGSRLSILDDGWGVRADTSDRYRHSVLEFVGVRQSRRWYRPESWAQVRAAQVSFPSLNPVSSRIRDAHAVLDLSAGDSFTDLYGWTRLRSVSAPKQAALRAKRPLILLPQTYGPFKTEQARRLARRLIRSAALAYARDPWSFDQLVELAGADADRSRLRNGVDVAFALEPREPAAEVADVIRRLRQTTTAGVNVSGLLLGDHARERFGLQGDYLSTVTDLVVQLISEGAHVLFVPHVHIPGGVGESDIAAISRVRADLTEVQRSQTTVLSPDLDAAEIKWCISQLDWFIGSRMHSTIAALSTLTPAVGYAYSDKTRGVFQTCGIEDQVIDARTWAGPDAVRMMVDSFLVRDTTRQRLSGPTSLTVEASRSQLRDVIEIARQLDPVAYLGSPQA